MNTNVDVFGIGNALLDTLVFVEDTFLHDHEITKGTMTLVDNKKQISIINALKSSTLTTTSGGSAANTMHGIALCGGSAAFVGKVAADAFGQAYDLDLKDAGITLESLPGNPEKAPTGSCLVLITPDGERSMLTNLGISATLSKQDYELNDILSTKILYIEGYLWDGKIQKEACLEALQFAKKNNVLRSFTFSDPFCVDRSKDEFRDLCQNHLDIVFCNKDEMMHYTGQPDFDKALELFSQDVKTAFITHSDKGAVIIHNNEISHVTGFPTQVKDTTGAGDAFAAGVLYGLTQGFDHKKAVKIGNFLGSKIVQKEGARLTKEDIEGFDKVS